MAAVPGARESGASPRRRDAVRGGITTELPNVRGSSGNAERGASLSHVYVVRVKTDKWWECGSFAWCRGMRERLIECLHTFVVVDESTFHDNNAGPRFTTPVTPEIKASKKTAISADVQMS